MSPRIGGVYYFYNVDYTGEEKEELVHTLSILLNRR